MTFRFDNYIVCTERKEESLNEQIALPQKIISGKPSNYIWQYKARSFVTFQLFAMRFSTTQKFHNIFNNIFDMIDFIEILKAFSGKKLEQKKEYILNKQIIRSGTAICALISEAKFAQSRADFLNKLMVALKEANETQYWINLLYDTEYISKPMYYSILKDNKEIVGLLVSITKTLKNKSI